MTLSKNYNPKQIEEKIYPKWEESGFFNPDNLPGERKETYTLLLPPPNVTGQLHMGHALNAVIQDVLARQKRMQGYKVLWLPGTDHAGIATQNVVEKELLKENKTRFDLGREKFIEKVWEWKNEYGNTILQQLKKLGSSCDWSRTVFTLDQQYARAVKKAFIHYWEKGFIYSGTRPVNWCPRCKTSLSDLEVKHKEKKGKIWYIKYPFKNEDGHITVATTRPETMLGDSAVAVNPDDERYKDLVGKTIVLPLVKREVPIVADTLVNSEFGTGAVKVTPAHDIMDYQIGNKHKLESIQIINSDSEIVSPAPSEFQGMPASKAREKVVEQLKEQGLLEKQEDYQISVPYCDRCGTLIETIPSKQWFLKMNELAKRTKKEIEDGNINIQPKNFTKISLDWLNNIRDWCISRQIWWGHRIPIWQCQKTGKYFAHIETPSQCNICQECQPKQVEDVLDTWFSSALWPFATLGWPEETKDLEEFYPSDVLVTARDIINLWVSRMIFSGLEFMKQDPFPTTLIHPTVLTKTGQRMSKSLGTGINPMQLQEKYGVDATRFGIAWQITRVQDIRFNEDALIMGEKFCNKIWNASRFIIQNINQTELDVKNQELEEESLTDYHKQTLKRLKKTIKETNQFLENYNLGKATESIYHFFWNEFCAVCLEKSKADLKDPQYKEVTQKVLLYILLNSLKLLHPFMPFITEEIYQNLPIKDKKEFLMIEEWPE